MKIEQLPLHAIKPNERNSRTHSDEQVADIAKSITEFGWTVPLLIDEDGMLLAGHGRLRAAQLLGLDAAPCHRKTGLTEAQKRAYVIADNKLAQGSEWDEELLRLELKDLMAADFDMGVLGFDEDELNALLTQGEEPEGGGVGTEGLTDSDATPEPEAVVVSRPGDVWVLGGHRVMCGDSTSADDVARLLGGETAQLLHADPPYGMGKAADGVANDNLYGPKLDAFQMAWWNAFRPHLASNGTAYIWGNAPDLWRLWYAGGLADSEPLTMTNEIVWDKKSIAGMASPDMTQYPEASERCLFFKLGRHVLLVGQTKDDYWPGWEPIRTWLAAERERAGWKASDVTRIVGNHMQGHWFGKSQWQMISERDYGKLAAAAEGRAFTRTWADLHAEYRAQYAIFRGEVLEPRGEEFRAGRPFFDNAHDVMRDVWEFSRVTGEERHGHATPKPVAMMERVMRSSLREGGICAEPFGGSGSTLMGAERTGRRCFSMELQGMYVDVIVRRWQAYTGQEAILEETGSTFADVQAERLADEVPA